MTPEQLQTALNEAGLGAALSTFDSSELFDTLGAVLQPSTQFDTVSTRADLYDSASDIYASFSNAVPDDFRNFSDPSGMLVTTRFSQTDSNDVQETRLFGRVVRSVETDTNNVNESLTLGADTPVETTFSHTIAERSVENTFPLTPTLNNSNSTSTENFSLDSALLDAGLTQRETNVTGLGQSLDTNTTTLNVGVLDQVGLSLAVSDASLNGSRVIETVTLKYPGLEGEESTLLLPVSTNILVPLGLGIAEGFVSDPDPVAALDTLTALTTLPEPIGSLTDSVSGTGELPGLDTLGQ